MDSDHETETMLDDDRLWILVNIPPWDEADIHHEIKSSRCPIENTMLWYAAAHLPWISSNLDLSSRRNSFREEEHSQEGFDDAVSCRTALEDHEDKRGWLLVNKPPSPLKTLSWSDINSSMPVSQIKKMIESIIVQPDAKPWRDVQTMNPDLYHNIMDSLQLVLDRSTTTRSSFSKAAAIKSLLAINRISDVLPKDLVLQNVQMESKVAITCGGFADVWIGRYRSQRVCLKVLRIFADDQSSRVTKRFLQEALLWRQLRHSRVLPLLGINMEMAGRLCLISPWMAHGNVNEFLMRYPRHDRLKMLVEIAQGIEYLHTHDPPVVHADIRGANILVQDDLTCCLADFGLTMVVETRVPTYSRLGRGAAFWMSPEVWTQSDSYTSARDIYSFGCTAIEIFSGCHPFPDIKNAARILDEVVVKKNKPPRPNELHDAALWATIESCLAYEAARRPTATTVFDKLRSCYASSA